MATRRRKTHKKITSQVAKVTIRTRSFCDFCASFLAPKLRVWERISTGTTPLCGGRWVTSVGVWGIFLGRAVFQPLRATELPHRCAFPKPHFGNEEGKARMKGEWPPVRQAQGRLPGARHTKCLVEKPSLRTRSFCDVCASLWLSNPRVLHLYFAGIDSRKSFIRAMRSGS